MHIPQDDIQRQANRDLNRYGPPGHDPAAGTRGGLTGLLVVVILMGALIAFSMLSPSNTGDTTAPPSVIDGATSQQTPAAPVD
ncbi:conserved hypothetical protein [Roseovarius sp. EC-HK134]|uniref:Uncharacterized protein n=1 Tax=Roseovarius mucosus TaxID=215743 RepID=A0A1V0RK60_9RHOB|nr:MULTISPECIES: hypothetical protein [Roseovarius]ARE82096.1 hypothetical protein ROSMUCSMR3_00592 [Roseovarius mucosus]AWZ22135.1 Hypothetical protein RAK1035_3428 [Roseovarius sp. AK1035]EDM30407.1 hypothetical protein RTM1035_10380 [Roseovarius sp. TM1035]MBW4972411.1 hypothetical protein [Roseovarius mucosus]VVT26666.1 conserved hypothetical protein [Roseovarius sp. EC-HK134]